MTATIRCYSVYISRLFMFGNIPTAGTRATISRVLYIFDYCRLFGCRLVMNVKKGKTGMEYIEKDEYMKKNEAEFRKEVANAKIDDLIQPEIWKYLSPKMAGQLRRWVNQFIKANQEESEKLAIPFMNKKLRQRIMEIDLKLKAQQIKKMIDAKKAEKAKAVENE